MPATRKTKSSPPRVDIISIGALGRNLLWGESQPVRTPHATTTLIRSGSRHILVDPGLPPPVLKARIFERAGIGPDQIDTVFLTNSRAAHRGGLALFTSAKVLIHETEQAWARQQIENLLEVSTLGDDERTQLEYELRLFEQMSSPDDKLATGVDLFPLPGYSPGTCGLLVSAPLTTTIIAGDAVATSDHFLAGQVLPDSHDLKLAQASLLEVYEIADIIVPGHDNVFHNARLQGM